MNIANQSIIVKKEEFMKGEQVHIKIFGETIRKLLDGRNKILF